MVVVVVFNEVEVELQVLDAEQVVFLDPLEVRVDRLDPVVEDHFPLATGHRRDCTSQGIARP